MKILISVASVVKVPFTRSNLAKLLKKQVTGSLVVKDFKDGDGNDVIWITHTSIVRVRTKDITLILVLDKSKVTYNISTKVTVSPYRPGMHYTVKPGESMYDFPKAKFAHKNDLQLVVDTLMENKKVVGLLKKA